MFQTFAGQECTTTTLSDPSTLRLFINLDCFALLRHLNFRKESTNCFVFWIQSCVLSCETLVITGGSVMVCSRPIRWFQLYEHAGLFSQFFSPTKSDASSQPAVEVLKKLVSPQHGGACCVVLCGCNSTVGGSLGSVTRTVFKPESQQLCVLVLQLTQLPLNAKLSYSPEKAEEALPSVFHNIGDVEFQEHWARVWYVIVTFVFVYSVFPLRSLTAKEISFSPILRSRWLGACIMA